MKADSVRFRAPAASSDASSGVLFRWIVFCFCTFVFVGLIFWQTMVRCAHPVVAGFGLSSLMFVHFLSPRMVPSLKLRTRLQRLSVPVIIQKKVDVWRRLRGYLVLNRYLVLLVARCGAILFFLGIWSSGAQSLLGIVIRFAILLFLLTYTDFVSRKLSLGIFDFLWHFCYGKDRRKRTLSTNAAPIPLAAGNGEASPALSRSRLGISKSVVAQRKRHVMTAVAEDDADITPSRVVCAPPDVKGCVPMGMSEFKAPLPISGRNADGLFSVDDLGSKLSGESSELSIRTGRGGAIPRRRGLRRLMSIATEADFLRDQLPVLREKKSSEEHQMAEEVLMLLESFLPFPEEEIAQAPLSATTHQWIGNPVDQSFASGTSDKRSAFQCFCQSLIPLARMVQSRCLEENVIVQVKAPAYVIGDIHGNYYDLRLMSRSFWGFGADVAPTRFVFLGDYVDRGPHSVETVAYLFALKLIAPSKVFLLRGNHELRSVNGNDGVYGLLSFRTQCAEYGSGVWESFNSAFDCLPLCAILDSRIFCVHGGLPRTISQYSLGDVASETIFDRIRAIRRPIDDVATPAREGDANVLIDLLWADPATAEEEACLDSSEEKYPSGFGPSSFRDGGLIFGQTAIEEFCKQTRCTHIVRAHQPQRFGIWHSKKGRVLTIFSSSRYYGGNSAAVVLVDTGILRCFMTRQGKREKVFEISGYSYAH